MSVNPSNIILLLQEHFSGFTPSTPSANDQLLFKEFADTINRCIESSEYHIEADFGLTFDEYFDADSINYVEEEGDEESTEEEETEEIQEASQQSSSASEYNPSPIKKTKTLINDEYLRQALEYYKSSKKGTRSFASVKSKFKKLTSLSQLLKFEKRMNQPSNRREIIQEIKKEMIERFKDAICEHKVIKDEDLKRWALQTNRRLGGYREFKASDTFILNFKKKYRIVSRKITKLVTKKYSSNKSNIEHESKLFVETICRKIEDEKIKDDKIFNTDQSGFLKELHSGRTLTFRGRKSVESVVQSSSATTHSYTIQPVISKEGKLLSPMLICLQESSGKFPQKGIPAFKNIYSVAGKSSILTKEIALNWFEKVFFPSTPSGSLLIVDSWPGFRDIEAISQRSGGKNISVEVLPPKTTAVAQPLDVYFFRPYKNFVRTFSDMVVNDGISIDLFQREQILKIQSLTHNQFSSARFQDMIKYAWFASGYTQKKPPKFEVPTDYCFKNILTGHCEWVTNGQKCEDFSFIRCAYCEVVLCFNHFYRSYHTHFD